MGEIRITVKVSLVTTNIFHIVIQMHSISSKENLAKTPRFSNVNATKDLKGIQCHNEEENLSISLDKIVEV